MTSHLSCQPERSNSLLYLRPVLLRVIVVDVLARHSVEAVVPAVEGHPDGRDDVAPSLAGVLQRVLQVVQAVVPFAALESMSLAASPGGLCQLLSRPFTCVCSHLSVTAYALVLVGAKSASNVQTEAGTYQTLGEGIDVAEGLEAGEVRPDPGDGDADIGVGGGLLGVERRDRLDAAGLAGADQPALRNLNAELVGLILVRSEALLRLGGGLVRQSAGRGEQRRRRGGEDDAEQ
uniref:Uncharacterized protein n=1 Tax=Zea mays TaxID=4577 RepID=C0PM04_MAIZE|nr:unknown [Zea mays]